MGVWALALMGAMLLAEVPQRESAVRGVVLDWDAGLAGDISVRVRDNHVYCFRFDEATAVVRGGGRASMMDLQKGDTVEIVPASGPNPQLQRAASIEVLSERPLLPRQRIRTRPEYSILDELYPRGNLAFGGVVTGLTPERVVLQTRTHGEAEILIRHDTRFVHDGREVAASALRVNERVYVRGARNLDGAIEAYQVMWGDILRPR